MDVFGEVGQGVRLGEGLAPVTLNDSLHVASLGDAVRNGKELPEAVGLHAEGFRQRQPFFIQGVDYCRDPGSHERVLGSLSESSTVLMFRTAGGTW